MSVVRSDSWQGVWTELTNDIPSNYPLPFDESLPRLRGERAPITL
jgi:hypothetical protein